MCVNIHPHGVQLDVSASTLEESAFGLPGKNCISMNFKLNETKQAINEVHTFCTNEGNKSMKQRPWLSIERTENVVLNGCDDSCL